MKIHSVCIRCGNFKEHPQDRCRRCGLVPTTTRQKAESIILSGGYQTDDAYIARTEEELSAFSDDIENGRPVIFDEAEIRRITELGMDLENIPRISLGKGMIQMLLPLGLIILGVLYLMY